MFPSLKSALQVNWPYHQRTSDDSLSSSGEVGCFFNRDVAETSTAVNSPGYCELMAVVPFSQERIAKSHGSQCGFCTPGIVMSMYTLLRNKPEPEMEDIEDAFQGNTLRPADMQPVLFSLPLFHQKGWRCTFL